MLKGGGIFGHSDRLSFANEKGLNEQAKRATFTLIVVQKRHHTRFWAEKRIDSQLERDAMFVLFLFYIACALS